MWAKPRLQSSLERGSGEHRPRTAGDTLSRNLRYSPALSEPPVTLDRTAIINSYMDHRQDKRDPPGHRVTKNKNDRLTKVNNNEMSGHSDPQEPPDKPCEEASDTPITATWDAFNDYVKQVNDTSLISFKSREIKLRSSDIFQRVMDGIKPKMTAKMKLKKALQAQQLAETKQANEPVCCPEITEAETVQDEEDDKEEEDEDELRRREALRRRALRGWALIRRHVSEMKMKKKGKQGALNWNMLRHAMANMSDMEKARETLYDKYIYNPHTWLAGLSLIPEHLRLCRNDPKTHLTTLLKEQEKEFARNKVTYDISTSCSRGARRRATFSIAPPRRRKHATVNNV